MAHCCSRLSTQPHPMAGKDYSQRHIHRVGQDRVESFEEPSMSDHPQASTGLRCYQYRGVRTSATTHHAAPKCAHRGVHWDRTTGMWAASIGRVRLGLFNDQDVAARHRDIAIDFLVQEGVLRAEYIHIKNAKLGNLAEFSRTNKDIEWVKDWWLNRTERIKSSVYKGVYFLPLNKAPPWYAALKLRGAFYQLGQYETEEEAACVRDKAVRASGIPKRDRLLHINFFDKSDYLTKEEAEMEGGLGVVSIKAKPGLPFQSVRMNLSMYGTMLDITSQSSNQIKTLGFYSSMVEAVQVHDQDALMMWSQQEAPRGPLPPTNFPPATYGYRLPRSASVPIHEIVNPSKNGLSSSTKRTSLPKSLSDKDRDAKLAEMEDMKSAGTAEIGASSAVNNDHGETIARRAEIKVAVADEVGPLKEQVREMERKLDALLTIVCADAENETKMAPKREVG